MKILKIIAKGLFVTIAVAIAVLAIVISYESDCTLPAKVGDTADGMTAAVYGCYGSPEVISVQKVEKPVPADDEILVRVMAAGVNPLDWHYMRGSPYIMRLGSGIGAPSDVRLGVDFSGTVEAVGRNVTRFHVGDNVFGGASGAFAEFLVIREDRAVAKKPSNITHEEAAAVPIAAITALQALRDKGQLKAGQKVLINGASGGVGTYAVQIAKSLGAEVTAVCSTRNAELVRSIGADHVINYKTTDYTESPEKYDLIVDMIGNHSLSKNRGVLVEDGSLILVGGPSGDWLGPLIGPLKAMVVAPFVDQNIVTLLARLDSDGLRTLAALLQSGDVRSVIDKQYSLTDLADAIRYSESGRARGKIILMVAE